MDDAFKEDYNEELHDEDEEHRVRRSAWIWYKGAA